MARRRFLDPVSLKLLGPLLKGTAIYRRREIQAKLAEYGRRTGRGQAQIADSAVTLVGHVFAPTGRGEDVRACFRALGSVGIESRLVDIYGLSEPDENLLQELWNNLVDVTGTGFNIFFINADEVETVLAYLKATGRYLAGSYEIIYPVWELQQFPAKWARRLERFDEIWVPTRFIRDSIGPKVCRRVVLLPFASELPHRAVCRRQDLQLPEGRYLFLFFFDFTSYIQRKNPFAVLNAFDRFLRHRPGSNATLVLKLSGVRSESSEYEALRTRVTPLGEHVVLLDRILSGYQMMQLLECCDCFVSLHRSEGFGRGLAEAMSLGKPVIATAYSGNMDFMNEHNALLVDYDLVPVPEQEYPFASGQFWAEADVDQAAGYMTRLIDDPAWGRVLGARARQDINKTNGCVRVGRMYAERIREIELEHREAGRPGID